MKASAIDSLYIHILYIHIFRVRHASRVRYAPLGVQQHGISSHQPHIAIRDVNLSFSPHHDNQRLAGNVQISNALPGPWVAFFQNQLLECDTDVVLIAFRPQYNMVAMMNDGIAARDNDLPLSLDNG